MGFRGCAGSFTAAFHSGRRLCPRRGPSTLSSSVSSGGSALSGSGSLPFSVKVAVEGRLDEAVARYLLEFCGFDVGPVYGIRGRNAILERVAGYNEDARFGAHWFVLVDLDRNPDCAPELVRSVLPSPAPDMCFRVAVRSIEAWLLADRKGFASWAGIRLSDLPVDVESLEQPKGRLVDAVRQSRRRTLVDSIVPRQGSGRTEGPAYTSTLSEFVTDRWNIEAAAAAAPSLARAIRCLKDKVASPPTPGQ